MLKSITVVDLYNLFRFLKKFGNYSQDELENMYWFEMEIYYYMIIKEKEKEKENAK